MRDTFATAMNFRLPNYFSPLRDPQAIQKERFPNLLDALVELLTTQEGSTQTTSLPLVPLEPPRAKPSRVETIEHFTSHLGFSKQVAHQIALSRRPSIRQLYQRRWEAYRSWCRAKGHSVTKPTLPKIADSLLYLRKWEKLTASTIKGFRSTLSSVFKPILPEISGAYPPPRPPTGTNVFGQPIGRPQGSTHAQIPCWCPLRTRKDPGQRMPYPPSYAR